jgi:hypothetical protein
LCVGEHLARLEHGDDRKLPKLRFVEDLVARTSGEPQTERRAQIARGIAHCVDTDERRQVLAVHRRGRGDADVPVRAGQHRDA